MKVKEKEKGIDVLVCSLYGIEVERKRWSTHWIRAHKVYSNNDWKELEDGEVPTNPKWLANYDGLPMIEADVDSHSLRVMLPEIMKYIPK